MASDWLEAVLQANQKPGLISCSIFSNIYPINSVYIE